MFRDRVGRLRRFLVGLRLAKLPTSPPLADAHRPDAYLLAGVGRLALPGQLYLSYFML
jgi:hypothetical protein